MKVKLVLVRHKKGLMPRLIRWWCNSYYDHVALLTEEGIIHENDLSSGANGFHSAWLTTIEGEDEWETKTVATSLTTTHKKLSELRHEEYSLGHNMKTILYRFRWLRKYIKPRVRRSNCVGYFAKATGLPVEAQFAFPEELKEWTNGNTTQR